MSPCGQFRTRVHALVDGDVHGGRALALQIHASRCDGCAAVLDSARTVAADLRQAGRRASAPPASLVARILAAVPGTRGYRPPTAAAWLTGALLMAGAVLGAAVVAGIVWLAVGAIRGPLVPGLGGVVAAAGDWLARFSALALGLERFAGAGSGWSRVAPPSSALAGLLLLASGLGGVVATLCLGASRSIAAVRRSHT